MQEPRSTSTLELVINEQQMQNMSQIDLSRPGDSNRNNNSTTTAQQHQQSNPLSFQHLKEWPSRIKEGFSAKIDEAKAKSNSNTEFIFKLIQAFSGTAIWLLCFFCTIIVPIFLFFIGLFHLDNCQDRPSLPYLVFATGFTMTASNLFNLALALNIPVLTNQHILTSDIKNTIASIINIIFNCVVAFLYILCGYMVFTIGRKKQNSSSSSSSNDGEESSSVDVEDLMDCNHVLYYFTLWFVVLTMGLFALLTIVAIIFFAYNKYRLAIIRGSTPRSQTTANNINTNPASAF